MAGFHHDFSGFPTFGHRMPPQRMGFCSKDGSFYQSNIFFFSCTMGGSQQPLGLGMLCFRQGCGIFVKQPCLFDVFQNVWDVINYHWDTDTGAIVNIVWLPNLPDFFGENPTALGTTFYS
jgi:hypothetical protein